MTETKFNVKSVHCPVCYRREVMTTQVREFNMLDDYSIIIHFRCLGDHTWEHVYEHSVGQVTQYDCNIRGPVAPSHMSESAGLPK
jgi:hypothetical protein